MDHFLYVFDSVSFSFFPYSIIQRQESDETRKNRKRSESVEDEEERRSVRPA